MFSGIYDSNSFLNNFAQDIDFSQGGFDFPTLDDQGDSESSPKFPEGFDPGAFDPGAFDQGDFDFGDFSGGHDDFSDDTDSSWDSYLKQEHTKKQEARAAAREKQENEMNDPASDDSRKNGVVYYRKGGEFPPGGSLLL